MENDKQSILEFKGYVFKRVKSGLDENQVTDLIEKIINEKDELAKRQAHLSSLMKLAEKTISEADNMADQIKKEAESKAKEEAKQLLDTMISEAMDNANKQAETLKQGALAEAQGILQKRADELQAKLTKSAQQLCQRMIVQTESLAQELAALKVDIERDASTLPGYAVLNTANNSDGLSSPKTVNITQSTSSEQSHIIYANLIEVEILPPRDADEISKIRTFLNELPGVQAEPAVNFVDKTSIKVHTNNEINLTQVLSDQSYIKQVIEENKNGNHKIKVSLSLSSPLDESKDMLSRDIGRILDRR
jgi:cell division septum initiation protein DivIVA